jgi:ABC-type multidrug transport system fused ATPase/permease subunit
LVGLGLADAVTVAVVTLATLAAFEALAGLPAAWQGLDATTASATRLCEVFDEAPAVEATGSPAPMPVSIEIEARHLRFVYPGAAAPAIDDLSFTLHPGRLVAVVGPSGAGKSTLAHLLLRFWDVPAGSLLVGGQDVRRLDPDRVRRLFGFAGQRAHVFTGTIRDNLLVGRADADQDDLDRAVAAARFDEVVSSCPSRYDTWVGEQGHALSGGERQRLALARALLADAPYLLLDEPTANLDAETERNVLESIRAWASTRGVLLITHRLAGLSIADEILVLTAGTVVERGTFAGLMSNDGMFRRMVLLQRSAGVLDGADIEPA